MSDELNWIVPCRRAVVRARLGYAALLRDWARQCTLAEAKLQEWYFARWGEAGDVARGTRWLEELATYAEGVREEAVHPGGESPPGTRPAALETTNTFDEPRAHAWLRLWKGPYRVLDEAGGAAAVALGYRGEAQDYALELLPGDLIEVPLQRFLAVCLPETSPIKPRLWRLHFNPEGSPFLGTSLHDFNGAPEDAAALAEWTPPHPSGDLTLHDNLVAMRWQLLFNLGMGAFSSFERVYKESRAAGANYRYRGELGAVEGRTVHARGMMFGASLYMEVPEGPEDSGWPNVWLLGTNHWGIDRDPRPGGVIPTQASYDSVLVGSQPLTPGWTCSPHTLAAVYFMLDRPNGGSGGVRRMYESGDLPSARRTAREHFVGVAPRRQELDPVVGPVDLISGEGSAALAEGTTVEDSRPWSAGDLNITGLYNHEQTFVRLLPFDRLLTLGLEDGHPPYVGFIACYNPVTGEDYYFQQRSSDEATADETRDPASERGRLWKFEAAGSMDVNVRPQTRGASPHNWERIERNRGWFLKVHRANRRGAGLHGLVYHDVPSTAPEDFPRDRPAPTADDIDSGYPYSCLNHFLAFDLNQTTLGAAYAPGARLRPLVSGYRSHRLIGRVPAGGEDQDPADFVRLYAERAVLFLTLAEWAEASGYPNASEIDLSTSPAPSSSDAEGD